MAQRETPFDEALRILAGIIAQRHLRYQRGNAASALPEPKPLPDKNIDRSIDRIERHDGEGISGDI